MSEGRRWEIAVALDAADNKWQHGIGSGGYDMSDPLAYFYMLADAVLRFEETEHFRKCGCHDSWDQCPCADAGHPKDGSCDCCWLGTGLCGPRPVV
jgi:hypothetical protein